MSNKSIFSFNGRICRKDYFTGLLVLGIVNAVAILVTGSFGYVFQMILGLIFEIIALSYHVRRLHDIGMKGTIAMFPLVTITLLIPSDYWGGFIAYILIIYIAWFFYLTLIDTDPGANEFGDSPKPLPTEAILSSKMDNRKMIEKVIGIVCIALLLISQIYDFCTGRPLAYEPGTIKTFLPALENVIPCLLIVFDRTRKQILTYISIIYIYALEIPIFLMWLFIYGDYDLFKYLKLEQILLGMAIRADSIIIFVFLIYLIKKINSGKEVKPILFFFPSALSYLWGVVFDLILKGIGGFTEGIAIHGFNYAIESGFYYGCYHLALAFSFVCLYNRMKMRVIDQNLAQK